MEVVRIGLTPVKGGRHATPASVELSATGPVGDRVFCLVDPARRRVLRTVENPSLMALTWRWEQGMLRLAGPPGSHDGTPGDPGRGGETLEVDYWGRPTTVEVVPGPWSAACSRHLGYEVLLVRAPAGGVVYGEAVTVLTTASLARLPALRALGGMDAAAERFRSTLVVRTDAERVPPEQAWVGRSLEVGSAVLEVRGTVPRCAVIDLDPATGVRDVRLLRALAAAQDLGPGEEPWFGVQARVSRAGRVALGDPVRSR
ncbi:MOSC domain-containing protein [Nocardioidaceae bacterium]|nr:MOSC domain-containing protein [Nocardioidaceae bacterium]